MLKLSFLKHANRAFPKFCIILGGRRLFQAEGVAASRAKELDRLRKTIDSLKASEFEMSVKQVGEAAPNSRLPTSFTLLRL